MRSYVMDFGGIEDSVPPPQTTTGRPAARWSDKDKNNSTNWAPPQLLVVRVIVVVYIKQNRPHNHSCC